MLFISRSVKNVPYYLCDSGQKVVECVLKIFLLKFVSSCKTFTFKHVGI